MKRIALLIDDAFEDSEFIYPYRCLKEEGYPVDIIATRKGDFFGKKGSKVTAELDIAHAYAKNYAALYIPGGHAPDKLSESAEMRCFVQLFGQQDKILCAICHGPLLLARAAIVAGRRLTGYPGTETILLDAGANFMHTSVEIDDNLITARDPASLPEMTRAFITALEKYTD